jgi:diguanylate cyclase (GGDEF)-like protein
MGTGFGLYKYQNGVVTKYGSKNGLLDERNNLIYQDRQNRLWVGTKGGLSRLDGDRFVSFTTKEGLAGNRIRCIYEDPDGTMWIGTLDSGFSRFKDGRFTNYSTRNGLHNNGAFQILEGEHDYFWISSNRGIYRVSRKQLNDYADHKIPMVNSVVYGIQDGMLSVECNGERQPAGTRTQDGKLWFPTQDGVVVIDPKIVPYNTHLPLLSIESTTLDGNVINFTKGVVIEPGQSNFEISYAAPSSIKPEYNHFKYRLAGLDNDWIDGGSQHTVHYSHLPPGRYTFQVIGANSDGIWSDIGAACDIDVRPFFYETRLFLALCTFILVGLSVTGYAVRVHQLKGNEKRLTALVDQRTAELVKKTQQLEVANDKLEKLATLDGLTNIANHRRFQDFLGHEWQRSQRQQTPVSLLLMDVDFFKLYNDTYGHQGGDDCLKQVARVLAESVKRATDLAARYGGEEFAIVLSDTDDTGALAIAETVRSQIESLRIPHSASKVNQYVTLSIGVATAIPDIDTGQDSLIAAADQALYLAKEKGRNRCEAKFARRSLLGVS